MLTKSGKAKGRRFQNYIRDMMLMRAPSLTKDDVRSTPMGVNGPDIQLSTEGKLVYPWDVEVKNQERINIWKAWQQVESRVKDEMDGGEAPILFIKRNNTRPLVVMLADDFFGLRVKIGEENEVHE